MPDIPRPSPFLRDTFANRPTPGVPGRIYYSKDRGLLERDSGSVWERIKGGYGVYAADFASSGSGTDADPWPIQAIVDAITAVRDNIGPWGRRVFLDGGIFRGTTAIDFTAATSIDGLALIGAGMGSHGLVNPKGRGTLIDYTGTGTAIDLGTSLLDTSRIQLEDFTLNGTSSAVGGIRTTKVYRLGMQNIAVAGFSSSTAAARGTGQGVTAGAWGINLSDSFSGSAFNIHVHNCFHNFQVDFPANNGYEGNFGFIDVDGFAIGGSNRKGIRIKGASGAFNLNAMVIGITGTGSTGFQFSVCKGIAALSPFVEGWAASLTEIGIQIDNNVGKVTMINPFVTKIGVAGIRETANTYRPTIISPTFGDDSGTNSTGLALDGYFEILDEPLWRDEWTGQRYTTSYRPPVSWTIGPSFLDDFEGAGLHPRWAETGTGGTSSQVSLVDGVRRLSTGATAGNDRRLHMGGVLNFTRTFLATMFVKFKQSSIDVNTDVQIGFVQTDFDPTAIPAGTNHHALVSSIGGANFALSSADGTTQSSLTLGQAPTTAYRMLEVELRSGDIRAILDGVVRATKTTNLPGGSTLLQPYVGVNTDAGADKQVDIDFIRVRQFAT